jgi:hypothetical protein
MGLPFEYDVDRARSMGGRHIRIADGTIGTITDAGFASPACLRMLDDCMAMIEKDHFPKNIVGA